MNERNFYPQIKKYLSNFGTCACEVKITKTKRFSFSELKEHQENALWFCKNRSLSYKISDQSMGQKLCDLIFFKNSEAYLCVIFYELRNTKILFIDINDYLEFKKSHDMKSATYSELKLIAKKEF
jgi:hypothetical protein